jgi:hypothetical protein
MINDRPTTKFELGVLVAWLALCFGVVAFGIALSGCAWLNAPLTRAERAAHAFADELDCSHLMSSCRMVAPGVYRCTSWAERGKLDRPWCREDQDGTVTFRPRQ